MSAVAACFPFLAENLVVDSSLLDALVSHNLLTRSQTAQLVDQSVNNEQRLQFLFGCDGPLSARDNQAVVRLCDALRSCKREVIASRLQKAQEARERGECEIDSEAGNSNNAIRCVVLASLREKYDEVKFGMTSVFIQSLGVRSRKEMTVEELFVGDVLEIPDDEEVATMRVGERTAMSIHMPFACGNLAVDKRNDLVAKIAGLVDLHANDITMFQIPTSRGCFLSLFVPGGAALDLMRLAIKPGGLDCLADICVVPVVEVFISQLPPVNVSFSHHALREISPGVVLMGEAGVGKSSIVKQLAADSEVYLQESTARKWVLPDNVFVSRRGTSDEYTALHICEVPGMDAIRRSLTSNIFNHLHMAAGVVFVFALNSAESLFAAHDCLEEARLYAPSDAYFFLIGNKIDLPSQIAEKKITSFSSQFGIVSEHVFMTSCQNTQGIRDAFCTIAAAAHHVERPIAPPVKGDEAIGAALEKCKVS